MSADYSYLYDYLSVKAALENEFQNEPYEWYSQAAMEVISEGSKDGDSVPNIINRLYR